MFNFLKKKGENQVMAQPVPPVGGDSNPFNSPNFQQTKVEDDVASFEIPDFSEDDLNFDLGLGEFMPGSATSNQQIIDTKGLPIPEYKPPVNADQGVPMPPPPMPSISSEPVDLHTEPQIAKDVAVKEEGVQNTDVVPSPQTSLVTNEKESKFSWAAGGTEDDLPEDDLPKFNIVPTLSLAEIKDIDVASVKKKKKVAKPQKIIAKEEISVQASSEGLFLPKLTFNKLVIIADDTTRKSVAADFQKAGITQISETQEVYISDLTKTLKSIMESLLLADAKLFGEGE